MYGFMIYSHEQKMNTYCRIEHQQKLSANATTTAGGSSFMSIAKRGAEVVTNDTGEM